ncbi:MAG: hypothetical protein AABX11_00895 [Nanoarchaeota archaeon]
MVNIYLIPEWFFGLDLGMEFLTAIITIAIAISAIKIYKMTGDAPIKRFGLGFLMIGISFTIWAFAELFLIKSLDNGFRGIILERLQDFQILGIYAHIIFFIAGLVTLTYATFKINKDGVYYLLLGLSLLVMAVSLNKMITMNILSVFLLSFIAYHYFTEWRANRNKNTCKIFVAFLLLVFSNLSLIFSDYSMYTYVISHSLEVIAYLIMLQTLICTLKHNGKKEK